MILTICITVLFAVAMLYAFERGYFVKKNSLLAESDVLQYSVAFFVSSILAMSIPMYVSAYYETVSGKIISVNPRAGLLVETCEAVLKKTNSKQLVYFTVPKIHCGRVKYNLDEVVELTVSVQLKTAWWQGDSHNKYINLIPMKFQKQDTNLTKVVAN